MRSVYEQELKDLYVQLTSLGNAANESLHKAVTAYQNDDKELAHELFSDDLRINASTADIEKAAYRIIALQQPVAGDLRLIFTVLHCSQDIERIADHAVSIAKATMRLDENFKDAPQISQVLMEMAEKVQVMLTDAITAFMEQDSRGAKAIAERDEEVDALLSKLFKIVIKDMEEQSDVITSGVSYIGVARNLERIGDYVTNICERIVYLNTGEITELN